MLGKLGNLIPGLDNATLRQILTRGRGDLPPLFNNSSASFIRKLVPSKIRLLIDQVRRTASQGFHVQLWRFCSKYATEPNLAKYRQLLASDYAKKYIRSETLTRILQLAPDALRLIRFTPAQVTREANTVYQMCWNSILGFGCDSQSFGLGEEFRR